MSVTRIIGTTNISLGNPGPRGPSWPEQLAVAGEIDEPTNDATIEFLREPIVSATGAANDAADLANTKAALADEKATLADEKATLADQKATAAQAATDDANSAATAANDAADLAGTKADLADEKAALADQKATAAQTAAGAANTAAGDANAAATLANQKAALAVAATAGAQAVIDASPTLMAAKDTAVQAAGTATTAAASVAGSVTDIARMSPQLGPTWDPAEMAGDWYGAVTSPDGLYQYLSFLMATGAMRVNGLYDTFAAPTAGEDACPASQWIGTEGQGAILFDNALNVPFINLTQAEVARLFSLVGGLTAALLQTPGGLQSYDLSLLGFDPNVTSAGEDAGAAATWIGTATQGAILFDAALAITFLNLAQSEAQRIRALGYTSPTLLRDGNILIDPCQSTDFLFGKVTSRDGFITVVKQRNAGSNPVAIPDDPRMACLFPMWGQSTAGFGGAIGGTVPRQIVEALYSYNVFGMSKAGALSTITSGATDADAGLRDDFLPLLDLGGAFARAGYPATQSILSAMAVEMSFRAHGKTSPGVFHHLDWQGGAPLTTFIKGDGSSTYQIYKNMVAHVGDMAGLLKTKYGRQAWVPAVISFQGESGPYDGTWKTLYAQQVLDERADFVQAILTATGVTVPAPVALVQQTNLNDNTSSIPVPPSQLGAQIDQVMVCRDAVAAAALTNSKPTTQLIGPDYFCPVPDAYIHGPSPGKAMIAEIQGEAYRTIADGGVWEPLWTTVVTGQNGGYMVNRVGNIITLQYSRLGMDIEFDEGGFLNTNGNWSPSLTDGWVKPVADPYYGFYWGDSNGIHIIGAQRQRAQGGYFSQVQLTLSGTPDPADPLRHLSYGRHAFDTDVDMWATGRGSVRACLRESRYHKEGVLIPEFIWLWANNDVWLPGQAGVNI